jgi:predicted TIM-barrel fold metal-dependent hydrolase
MRRIDIHTHFHCLDFVKHLQGRSTLPRTLLERGSYVIECAHGLSIPSLPTLVDMEEKLRDMDQMYIDVAVLSHGLPLGPDVLDAQEADEWAMRINDDLARIIQTYPGKFLGLGSIGFGNVQRSLAEIDRCINTLACTAFKSSRISLTKCSTPRSFCRFSSILRLLAFQCICVQPFLSIPLGWITPAFFSGLASLMIVV